MFESESRWNAAKSCANIEVTNVHCAITFTSFSFVAPCLSFSLGSKGYKYWKFRFFKYIYKFLALNMCNPVTKGCEKQIHECNSNTISRIFKKMSRDPDTWPLPQRQGNEGMRMFLVRHCNLRRLFFFFCLLFSISAKWNLTPWGLIWWNSCRSLNFDWGGAKLWIYINNKNMKRNESIVLIITNGKAIITFVKQKRKDTCDTQDN